MSFPNAQHALVPSERPPAMVTVTHEHRVPHLPEGISQDVGACYQHLLKAGMAAIRLAEARLNGSATVMQFAAQEISEMTEAANACAKRIEHTLARHRRRNPEAGVR
jgi:hypothetical protein